MDHDRKSILFIGLYFNYLDDDPQLCCELSDPDDRTKCTPKCFQTTYISTLANMLKNSGGKPKRFRGKKWDPAPCSSCKYFEINQVLELIICSWYHLKCIGTPTPIQANQTKSADLLLRRGCQILQKNSRVHKLPPCPFIQILSRFILILSEFHPDKSGQSEFLKKSG